MFKSLTLCIITILLTGSSAVSANNLIQPKRSISCDQKNGDCSLLKMDQAPLNISNLQDNGLIEISSYDYRIEKETNPGFRNIKISARIKQNNVSILYRDQSVVVQDNKNFTIIVAVPKNTNKQVVTLTVVDHNGVFKGEQFRIQYNP
jgi:hypothetical protein